ncbi:MAG: TRAP transporter small permease [Deltaproteobacteria bacterium]|nr:TRAP transporter small permease [Deltaproteobacteria bacterium]
MKKIDQGVRDLATHLLYLAGGSVFAMVLVTCADVILRLFRRPLPGSYEIMAQLGALAVCFALAHTTSTKGHVSVSLFVDRLSPRSQNLIDAVTDLAGFALFALATWKLLLKGVAQQVDGQVSMTLGFPMYFTLYVMAFSTAVLCAVLLANFVTHAGKAAAKKS